MTRTSLAAGRLRFSPALLASLVFLTAVAFPLLEIAREGRPLTYALDDAYVHMAIAKNLAQCGVWGVTPFAFSGSSSSPAWVVLLSLLYRVCGVNEYLPFFLNVVAGVAALFVAAMILRTYGARPFTQTLVLIALVVLAPMPSTAFTGMEHTLHLCLSFLLVHSVIRALCAPDCGPTGGFPYLLSSLTVATRYEALATVFVLSSLSFLKKRYRLGVLLGLASLIPVTAYALYAVASGDLPLPDSVLLKARPLQERSLADGTHLLTSLLATFIRLGWFAHVSAITAALAAAYLFCTTPAERKNLTANVAWLLVGIGNMVLQVAFGQLGWFYRYEMYAMGIGFLALGICIGASSGFKRKVSVVLLVVCCLVGVPRGYAACTSIGRASGNIFDQQYQMAMFVRRFYPEQTVVVHDIGALAFFNDKARIVDLYGLAAPQVARAKLGGLYDRTIVQRVSSSAGAKIAMVCPSWLAESGGAPPGWRKICSWRIANNLVCKDSQVDIYSLDASAREELSRGLSAYQASLPTGVITTFARSQDAQAVSGAGFSPASAIPGNSAAQ
jgi:hypothetical protein